MMLSSSNYIYVVSQNQNVYPTAKDHLKKVVFKVCVEAKGDY